MLLFDWDDANREHIALHNVLPEEAEEVFLSELLAVDFYVIDGEDRVEEVGITKAGRILFIVTIIRKQRIRVVTVYDAPKALKADFLQFHKHYYG